MKHVSHYDKVMWSLYCEYSYIPSDATYVQKQKYEWCDVLDMRRCVGSYMEKTITRSAEQWSFVHSKYYGITKVEPIYSGTLKDFVDYLEYRTWGGRHRRSPYDYKKNGYSFRYSNRCGKNSYRWRHTRGVRTKDSKKPAHIVKKTLSEEEIRKREWKKKVKDPRDQGSRFYSGSHKKDALRTGNRAERRHTKVKFRSGDWEAYSKTYFQGEDQMEAWYAHNEWDSYQDKGKRCWVNPWDWD